MLIAAKVLLLRFVYFLFQQILVHYARQDLRNLDLLINIQTIFDIITKFRNPLPIVRKYTSILYSVIPCQSFTSHFPAQQRNIIVSHQTKNHFRLVSAGSVTSPRCPLATFMQSVLSSAELPWLPCPSQQKATGFSPLCLPPLGCFSLHRSPSPQAYW